MALVTVRCHHQRSRLRDAYLNPDPATLMVKDSFVRGRQHSIIYREVYVHHDEQLTTGQRTTMTMEVVSEMTMQLMLCFSLAHLCISTPSSTPSSGYKRS